MQIFRMNAMQRQHWLCCMQNYVEVAVFAKKLTKERVSVTIGKQQLDVVIRNEQVLRCILYPIPFSLPRRCSIWRLQPGSQQVWRQGLMSTCTTPKWVCPGAAGRAGV
jgi:hypothetical protein